MSNAFELLSNLLTNAASKMHKLEEQYLMNTNVQLTFNEIQILANIASMTNTTMTMLAKQLVITKGSLSVAVSTLIKKGYLIKQQDINDKRIYHLKLQPAAQQALNLHQKFQEEVVGYLVKQFNLDQNTNLLASLESFNHYFDQLSPKK
jgi:DNA-binding MarR family transcriptional regulator